MASQFNLRSPAVKRLMREAEELHEPTVDYYAQPLEDNLFEWHFTVRGPTDSDFQDGYYHGRIILPTEYPMKPPSIILLTPNGRFETNKKICLSISGHHPESWQPSWSIRTALLAIIGFMPTEGLGAIGSLDFSSEERQQLAIKSQSWACPSCGTIKSLLRERQESSTSDEVVVDKDRELAKQICFKQGSQSHQDGETSQTSVAISSSQPTVQPFNVDSNQETSTDGARFRGRESDEHSTLQENVQQQNVNLDSSGPYASTYLIIILIAAIIFLLFRRFLL